PTRTSSRSPSSRPRPCSWSSACSTPPASCSCATLPPMGEPALPKQTTPTWEIELLVSGVAVFAMIDVRGLPQGRHELTVMEPVGDSGDDDDGDDAPRPQRIPFWR